MGHTGNMIEAPAESEACIAPVEKIPAEEVAVVEEVAAAAEEEVAEAAEPVAAQAYTFHHLGDATWANYQSKSIAEYLMKWNLDKHANLLKFRFDQNFERFKAEEFIRDFFSDPTVQTHVQVQAKSGGWIRGPGAPKKVRFHPLSTTATNLDLFDCLKNDEHVLSEGPVCREDGKIAGCFEEWEEGVCVQDRLRKALCCRDSEEYEMFPEHTRKELLFQLFKHLALGGAMNQWEDVVDPYLEATKLIYKDLVRVRKSPESGQVEVTTLAYLVSNVDGAVDLFPNRDQPNNMCLLMIDPVPRHITCYYFGVVGFL